MKIIGIGEVVWDCLPDGKKLGGAPINFSFFAKESGADSYPISAIGNDDLGDDTLAELKKTGLDLSYISRNDYPTSKVLISLDAAGVPQYEIVENVAWDAMECTPATIELISDADAVCWGSLAQRSEKSRVAIGQMIDAAPKSALRVFDINIRRHFYSKEIVEESLQKANVLKLNEDELPLIISLFSLPADFSVALAEMIVRYSLKYVIFTQGAVCSSIYDATGEVSNIATPKVEVVDTVGAGDSFTATFVVNILKGASIVEAHRKAVEVSAYACTQAGAINPLPDSKK